MQFLNEVLLEALDVFKNFQKSIYSTTNLNFWFISIGSDFSKSETVLGQILQSACLVYIIRFSFFHFSPTGLVPEVPLLQAFENEVGRGWTRLIIAILTMICLCFSLLELSLPLHRMVSSSEISLKLSLNLESDIALALKWMIRNFSCNLVQKIRSKAIFSYCFSIFNVFYDTILNRKGTFWTEIIYTAMALKIVWLQFLLYGRWSKHFFNVSLRTLG